MTTNPPRRLIIGISGASGTVYGIRMLELLRDTDIETHLVMSKSAELTMTPSQTVPVSDDGEAGKLLLRWGDARA